MANDSNRKPLTFGERLRYGTDFAFAQLRGYGFAGTERNRGGRDGLPSSVGFGNYGPTLPRYAGAGFSAGVRELERSTSHTATRPRRSGRLA